VDLPVTILNSLSFLKDVPNVKLDVVLPAVYNAIVRRNTITERVTANKEIVVEDTPSNENAQCVAVPVEEVEIARESTATLSEADAVNHVKGFCDLH
jgi:hypothetical protein